MEDNRPNLLMQLLHEMELQLRPAAIEELIRLLRSSHFYLLTREHIRSIGDYQTIEIQGECYFERSFSPGKETSSSLDLSRMLGRDAALADLLDLRANIIEAT